jgi:hypothetical protein
MVDEANKVFMAVMKIILAIAVTGGSNLFTRPETQDNISRANDPEGQIEGN